MLLARGDREEGVQLRSLAGQLVPVLGARGATLARALLAGSVGGTPADRGVLWGPTGRGILTVRTRGAAPVGSMAVERDAISGDGAAWLLVFSLLCCQELPSLPRPSTVLAAGPRVDE